MIKTCLLLMSLLSGGFCLWGAGVERLRCEYVDNPIGVDVSSPRLSWILRTTERGVRQSAYRILVSSTPEQLRRDEGDMWDSRKVESDQSVQVVYSGKPLQSGRPYYWKVQVWDGSGKQGVWSSPSFWSMGLTDDHAWSSARWIARKPESQWQQEWDAHKSEESARREKTWPWFNGLGRTIWELYDSSSPHYDASPLFRKEFQSTHRVSRAMLYICGLGYYEAYINGHRVGDHVLDPAWTNFHQRSFYSTYDVSGLIRRGDNALGIMLGRGQYNPLCNDIWKLNQSRWVGQPKTIALLRIEYSDGGSEDIVTDGSWKCSDGPIVYDDTRHGELYDARKEQPGWSSSRFDQRTWHPVSEVAGSGRLCSQMMPPVRAFCPVQPIKTVVRNSRQTLYDVGRNLSGWARVKVRGPEGSKVLVEYCELPSDKELVPDLHPSKMDFSVSDPDYAEFYDKAINIRQQNGYILRGVGTETFECHFSYKGFQYIRVTTDQGVKVVQVEAVPVHTDVAQAGHFTCSDTTVNRLQDISCKTLLNNLHSIPTDCPHREKQGWTADTYMTDATAIYNFDMAAFYSKWCEDLAGTEGPRGGLCTVAPSTGYDQSISTVWPAAIVFVPWDLLGYYGDRRVLEGHYELMKRFARSSLLRQLPGKPEIIGEVLGDWVSPHMTLSDNMVSYDMAPPEGLSLYGTASHYRVVKRLAEIGRYLGKNEEAAQMDQWAERIAEAFHKEFFDPRTQTYHGEKPTPYRQAANVVPLEYGITPEQYRSAVSDALLGDLKAKEARIGTGFVGTMALMDYLPEVDPELAYRVAVQPVYPGWGFMVKHGATAMWETWDGSSSRNHPPFCLISGYFYKYLAGIRCDWRDPGFKHFTIDPSVVGDLTHVEAWHESPYGRIVSEWHLNGNRLTVEVTVPANSTATVCVPTSDPAAIKESGKSAALSSGVKQLQSAQGKARFEVGSGNYIFESIL